MPLVFALEQEQSLPNYLHHSASQFTNLSHPLPQLLMGSCHSNWRLLDCLMKLPLQILTVAMTQLVNPSRRFAKFLEKTLKEITLGFFLISRTGFWNCSASRTLDAESSVQRKMSALLISAARKREMLHVPQIMAAEGERQWGTPRTVKSSPTAAVIPPPRLVSLPWKMNWIFSQRLNFTEDDEEAVTNQKPAGKPQTWFLCTSAAALLLETNLPLVQFLILQQQGKSHQFLLWVAKGNGCVRKFNTHAFINLLDEQLPHDTHSTAVVS